MIIGSVKNDSYSIAPVGNSQTISSNNINDKAASVAATNGVQAAELRQNDSDAVNNSKTKSISKDELDGKVEVLNKFIQSINPDMQFAVHEKTQQLMVKFVDVRANRVLKEFPAPNFLDMMADIGHYVGMLLDKKL